MQSNSPKKGRMEDVKKVSIPCAKYDTYKLSECKRIIDLRDLFDVMDRPV